MRRQRKQIAHRGGPKGRSRCRQGTQLAHKDRRQAAPALFKRLNLQSNYPPAYEVCVYPLTQLLARQRQLRWQILGAGGVLLLGGFVVSDFFSRRLSRPVEELAVVSEENLAQRQRAEAELETTAEELQRSARFSADASHQLKSPITVLRAGLDSLLARDGFPPGDLRGNLVAHSPDLSAHRRGRRSSSPFAHGCREIAAESPHRRPGAPGGRMD